MKTKMRAILHFLIPALEVRALRNFKAYVHERLDEAGVPEYPGGIHSLAGCRVGDRLDLLIGDRDEAKRAYAAAPSFIEKAIRDDKFGTEIAEAVKAEAVKHLAPALSREYARILDQIAWTLPPPSAGGPLAGTSMSAFEAQAETYHVRVELPQLNYDIQIVNFRR